LGLTVQFLQRSHDLRLEFSPRDGIHVLQFALKRLMQNPNHPLGKEALWREALVSVLGDEALDLDAMAEERQRTLGASHLPTGLGDFFFSEDDPLNPDRDEDSDEDEEGDR
jgi:hypothetical protein